MKLRSRILTDGFFFFFSLTNSQLSFAVFIVAFYVDSYLPAVYLSVLHYCFELTLCFAFCLQLTSFL